MRIKRIDLIGFKSFCDKASLDFQRPVTGIVGPNGCGKSNVVDALRWAMGEQSARHLRGKSMEDVIFNGSDSRGPSGTAEVSITFENDGVVPLEYLDYAEITVTRRLNRDGTSEYLMNKVPCRLRDITNLFLGTGAGTRAYSIIEQGRIGLIVSARPEDRRHFIEEAAGITKFQRRKQAAERKMDATRQNLLRVSDVLEEIGKRLGTLRRQAQKAERYKAYREEMRDVELCSGSHRLLEILAETTYQTGALAALTDRIAQAKADLEAGDEVLNAARLGQSELEREVNHINEALYGLENKIKLNENTVEFHGREATELAQRADVALEEIQTLTVEDETSRADLDAVCEQACAAAARHTELSGQVSMRAERLSGLSEELTEVQQAAELERGAISAAERAGASGEASLRALLQRRQDLQDRSDHKRDEMHRMIDRIACLRASSKDLGGELASLQKDVAELAQERDHVKQELTELAEVGKRGEAELEALRTELHRKRSRLTSLQEIQERYEGFSQGTRAIMKRAQSGELGGDGILGLLADKVEAPQAYETALEAVLGQRLGTVIVDDERIGLESIAYLKQSAEGRTSFIARWARSGGVLRQAEVGFVWQPGGDQNADADGEPIARAPRQAERGFRAPGVHGAILDLIRVDPAIRHAASALLGDVIVVENLERALALWDAVDGKTLVTLDGEIFGADGMVTGGSQDAELSGVLRHKREIKEVTEVIGELEAAYQTQLDAHVGVKTRMATLQQVLDELTRDGHQGDKDLITREKDLSRVESDVTAAQKRREELEEEIQDLRQLGDGLSDDEQGLKQEIARAAVDRHLGQDMVYLLGRELDRLRRQVSIANAAVTDLKVELAQADASRHAAEERVRRLEEASRAREERLRRLTEERAGGLVRASELREHIEELRSELLRLCSERATAKDRLEECKRAHGAQLERVAELELEVKERRAEEAKVRGESNEIHIKLRELSMSRAHLEEQIWERYRLELGRVVGDYHLRPPVTDEQLDRMNKLRQLIERMGEINLTAIEEYEELSGRHAFLSTHKEDLDDALNQLQRAIQKINRTSRARFRETFDAVNEKFQEVFPRLFRGGRAKLMLTDPDNLLETGVEIIAQPPGKKLQSIELLSGGEKALTAVSVIFSMFLVKPTPFCLLDEVDAPLDEANVGRFNEIVRETSRISQFIVITHNRRTMEVADRLYGVTMEEPGISKLVAVNLSGDDFAEHGGTQPKDAAGAA